MKLSISRAGSAVVIGALALTLAACGSDNPTGDAATDAATDATSTPAVEISGTFKGAGSSAQQNAINAWTAAFQGEHPGVTINYDGSGSGAGREQFIAGGVAWAGSDSPMKPEELESAKAPAACGPDGAIDIPVYISPIALAFNVPGVKELNISSQNAAKIFTGAITNWNDPALAADNEGATLPDLAITPVHRSDKSGTTNNFTDWLNKTAGDVWTNPKNDEWPLQGGDAAEKTSGVIGVVTDTPGAITYADESGVGADLGVAAINVGDQWVKPNAEGAANVVATSPVGGDGRAENDLAVSIDRTASAEGDYPLLLVSYGIVCNTYSDEATGNFVKAWIGYIVSEEGQQVAAQAAGSAPLSGDIATKAIAAAAAIQVG
ncbi:phosphate ABC transporter substrate-binding protein PstS [Xylanimonas protaetiae]|uniref:Phosphate-binding protein n=1 Tax=Xylanimonas protaetiae TaxID=2509457 RepID=A0A4P6F7E9_9MICO|nr:phosphate ABC transporter substrate-binding protein PstS [Xylanimonas protaetiae]QAY69177.1 phosphate ABC transporter substrate-binding protein PstS [Xylanimonas protaetiae]